METTAPKYKEKSVDSQWISANAGSGKTTALVDRVITLLLLGVLPERICCITYTKAAAGEMHERILTSLRRLLVQDDEACHATIRKLLGYSDVERLTLARSLFARVLDSPMGGLQLTTIHGFCQSLLRRFPMEAGLSPHFTVLEEMESEQLHRRARQALIRQATEGSALAEALTVISERSGEHGFGELLKSASARRHAWEPYRGMLPEAMRARVFETHGLKADISAQQLTQLAIETLIPDAMQAPLRASLGQFSSVTDAKFAAVFTPWLDGSGDKERLLETLADLFFTSSNDFGPKKSPFTKKVPMPEFMASLQTQMVRYIEQCRTIACAEESVAVILVARAFLDHYDRLKQQRQALDYEDLIVRTEQLLTTCGGWVMSQLDHRIDHLMVDEAQDTSPGQWRIVHTLVEELMATNGGIGSGGVNRTFLVVGDEKQSIFGFHGADPKQFTHEKQSFAELMQASGQPFENRALTDSYRSSKAVLDVVDAVSLLPDVAQSLSATGEAVAHRFVRTDRKGKVVLHPPVSAPEKQKPEAFTIPSEYLITDSAPQLLANQMAETIKIWLDEGRYTAGDILILLWHRQPFADCLIRALERAEIPVAGIDRLTLSEHLAVRDLLALMRWCDYPGDDLALAQVLRSPMIGMTLETLEAIAAHRPTSLWQAVQMKEPSIAAQLETWRESRALEPYAFLTQMLEVEGGRKRFAARFGEEVHEVLDELKTLAASMPSNIPATLAAFDDWCGKSAREVKRQQEARSTSVRIMTVHGAKGLEAPVVLLADTVRVPSTQRETTFADAKGNYAALSTEGRLAGAYKEAKEIKKRELFREYYRLLYVALTRASLELHVFAAGESKPESWYNRVREGLTFLGAEKEGEQLIWADAGITATADAISVCAKPALPAWASKQPPAPPLAERIWSPSRLLNEAGPVQPSPMASGGDSAERGVRIHRVLQFLTAASDKAHIETLLALTAPDWDDATRDAVAQEILRLHQQETWLWTSPAQAEISVGGTVEIQGTPYRFSGQIDRLVLTDDSAIVVDYKTGRHIPANPQQVTEGYRLQMKLYAALLAQLYPAKTVRTALLWTAEPRLMWLDEVLETTPWPDLTHNLTKN
jgi:ATP-dependent helicase/nuclease subunit A